VTSFLPLLLVGLMVVACVLFGGRTAKPHGAATVTTEPERLTTSTGCFMVSL
jgi:hypothetical protein